MTLDQRHARRRAGTVRLAQFWPFDYLFGHRRKGLFSPKERLDFHAGGAALCQVIAQNSYAL